MILNLKLHKSKVNIYKNITFSIGLSLILLIIDLILNILIYK